VLFSEPKLAAIFFLPRPLLNLLNFILLRPRPLHFYVSGQRPSLASTAHYYYHGLVQFDCCIMAILNSWQSNWTKLVIIIMCSFRKTWPLTRYVEMYVIVAHTGEQRFSDRWIGSLNHGRRYWAIFLDNIYIGQSPIGRKHYKVAYSVAFSVFDRRECTLPPLTAMLSMCLS